MKKALSAIKVASYFMEIPIARKLTMISYSNFTLICSDSEQEEQDKSNKIETHPLARWRSVNYKFRNNELNIIISLKSGKPNFP